MRRIGMLLGLGLLAVGLMVVRGPSVAHAYNYQAYRVLGLDSAGSAHSLMTTTAGNTVTIESAQVGGVVSEQCVTNGAGGSAVALPAGTVQFELQNAGPNAVHCTLDGTAPTAALGRRIAGLTTGTTSVADKWLVPCGAGACTVKCIADTAAQSTGACLELTALK